MGRVIHLNNPGRERSGLIRLLKIAVISFAEDLSMEDRQDLAAYIVLSLAAISRTMEQTVQAWEKRGYWLKADRFRQEWQWADDFEKKLAVALIGNDWESVLSLVEQVSRKLEEVELPKRPSKERPWEGAYQIFLTSHRPK